MNYKAISKLLHKKLRANNKLNIFKTTNGVLEMSTQENLISVASFWLL